MVAGVETLMLLCLVVIGCAERGSPQVLEGGAHTVLVPPAPTGLGQSAGVCLQGYRVRYRPTPLALLVAGAFFMEFLDGSIIATALPRMAPALHTTAVALNVGITAYLLTVAVFILPSGWAADRLGTRSVFSGAIVVFTVGSVLSGVSTSEPSFVAARVLQGLGGAMMVPVGRLAVLRTTPKAELMGAIAVLTWPGLAAPIIAPPIGGLLADDLSWRWIFFINVPLGLVGLALSLRYVPRVSSAAGPFDVLGFAFGAAACLDATFFLDRLGQPGRPVLSVLLGVLLVLLMMALVRHLRRHSHPLVDLAAFSIPTFRAVTLGGAAMRVLINTLPFLLPLAFELGYGLSAFRAGLFVLALFVGNLGMKPFTSRILKRWGFRVTLVADGLLQAATMLGCAALIPMGLPPLTILVLVASGASRSLQFTALNTLAFADVPEEATSAANTLFSVAFQLGVGFGVAFGASALRLATAVLHQGVPDRTAFELAFTIIAIITAIVAVDGLRLHPEAGAIVSGRQPMPSLKALDPQQSQYRRCNVFAWRALPRADVLKSQQAKPVCAGIQSGDVNP